MTITYDEHTILPPADEGAALAALDAFLDADRVTKLVGPQGEELVLPPEAFEVLRQAVSALNAGLAVTIAPHGQRLTTQEAADFLGVSRPTLVRLLENGEIPFERPGRHRRVLLADLLAYRERVRNDRQASLARMVEITHDADLYNQTPTPIPTR